MNFTKNFKYIVKIINSNYIRIFEIKFDINVNCIYLTNF